MVDDDILGVAADRIKGPGVRAVRVLPVGVEGSHMAWEGGLGRVAATHT